MPASLTDLAERSIPEQWGSLVNACRRSSFKDLYSLIFQLSLMSLNSTTDMDAILILVAFASLSALRKLQPPSAPSFNEFSLKEVPTLQLLLRVFSIDHPEKPSRKMDMTEKLHRQIYEDEKKRLAKHLLSQWPNQEILSGDFDSDILDVGLAMERIIPEWHRLHTNLNLSKFVTQVQNTLDLHQEPMNSPIYSSEFQLPKPFCMSPRGSVIPSVSKDLIKKSIVMLVDLPEFEPFHDEVSSMKPSSNEDPGRKELPKETVELRNILTGFTSSPTTLRYQYVHDLSASFDALETTSSKSKRLCPTPNTTVNARTIHRLRARVRAQFLQIRNALTIDDDRFQWLELGNLWPCNTPMEILEQLRSSSMIPLEDGVKELLLSHGVLITMLQKHLRIHNALCDGKGTQLHEELANTGHENWSPSDFPDWLLLEIDSNILIREEQIDVAHAIIGPESRLNTVLQLDMGKGKTSCIVPMAMAIRRSGEQLSRLIVPKPLLLPTAQTIQSRLGGMVGREVRHIPFSRRTKINAETLELYKSLHRDIFHRRGIILSTPEHILSYKLSGLQYLSSSELDVAREMVHFQSWLELTCRDVLDESGVSLAVKTQLIFPSDELNMVDGHPHRWQVARSLLSLVRDHLPELRERYPRSIEVIKRDNGYPMVFFLQSDVEEDLHRRIVEEISTGRTEIMRFASPTSSSHYVNIRKILLDKQLDKKLLKRVAKLSEDRAAASKTLLLVRGLLHNRILLLYLKKRWNVQYGLHPGRDLIAVPFEAKGVPSEQAEFGHPDAVILFTCLAFYYSGLNSAQFREALQHVLASHDPSSEYDTWTSSCSNFPEALRHWNVINVDDNDQVVEL